MTLGTFFLHSELGERAAAGKYKVGRAAPRELCRLHVECGAQATQPPGSYHDFFGNGAEREPIDWAGLFYVQPAESAVTSLCPV